jgi:Cu(I)/Ag(I) efflux system periplasmic protein CusF
MKMKMMMKMSKTLAVLAAAALPAVALADKHLADAEVRKVDKEAGKITLKHGEIRNLDMPPMTMVFQVKDKAVLDTVKQGDKVKFTAEKINGAYTVTSIEGATK